MSTGRSPALGGTAPIISPTVEEIGTLGESWRPRRSYATLHLWNSLAP